MKQQKIRITKKEWEKLGGFEHFDIKFKIWRKHNTRCWCYYKTTWAV